MIDRDSQTDARVRVRRATPADAEAITVVLAAVVAERAFSAIDRPWSVDEQRRYLAALGEREAFHLAEVAGAVVGYQSLDRYSSFLPSMAHVAGLGTFVRAEWRGRGIGQALFTFTRRFAADAGYRKFVVYVRGSNTGAQRFYQRLGFVPCGRLTRQTVIDGRDDDEVLMEYFLQSQ